MITSLNLDYDLLDSNIGYVIGDHDNVVSGSLIPVYIPKLMSSIERSNEITSDTIAIESPRYIFCNSEGTMPNIKNRIKIQNYILAKAAKGNYINGLKNGQKVSIYFANNSLRSIYFYDTLRDEIDTSNEEGKTYLKDDLILIGAKANYDEM